MTVKTNGTPNANADANAKSNASGTPNVDPADNDDDDQLPDDNDKPEHVSRDAYLRAVAAEKRAKRERDALKAAQAERERVEAESKGEYQKLLETERAELARLKAELSQRDDRDLTMRKTAALVRAADVDEKFIRFLDPDDIQIDEATGEIDPVSLKKAAANIRTNYPEFVKAKGTGGNQRLPNQAPTGDGRPAQIMYADWLKLPKSEKLKYKMDQLIK